MAPKKAPNFLEIVPVPSTRIGTIYENNLVILSTPRFTKPWMAKLFLFGKKNEVHTSLDENGSRVWMLIDGKRTVQEILDELSYMTEKEENFNERTLLFLQQLMSYGAISYETDRKTIIA